MFTIKHLTWIFQVMQISKTKPEHNVIHTLKNPIGISVSINIVLRKSKQGEKHSTGWNLEDYYPYIGKHGRI